MRKIRVARRAHLGAMRLHREDIGAIERVFVDGRVIGPDPLDELELTHHGGDRSSVGRYAAPDTLVRAARPVTSAPPVIIASGLFVRRPARPQGEIGLEIPLLLP